MTLSVCCIYILLCPCIPFYLNTSHCIQCSLPPRLPSPSQLCQINVSISATPAHQRNSSGHFHGFILTLFYGTKHRTYTKTQLPYKMPQDQTRWCMLCFLFFSGYAAVILTSITCQAFVGIRTFYCYVPSIFLNCIFQACASSFCLEKSIDVLLLFFLLCCVERTLLSVAVHCNYFAMCEFFQTGQSAGV